MDKRAISRRNDCMHHAHHFARYENRRVGLRNCRIWVQRAMREAPLSAIQINNLVCILGSREDAMWVLGAEQ